MAVVTLVGDDEHGGVVGGPLLMLPRGAPLGAAAPVVPVRVGGPVDGLLPVLAPRVLVAGDVGRRRRVGRRLGPAAAVTRTVRRDNPCRLAPFRLPQAVAPRGAGLGKVVVRGGGGGGGGVLALRQGGLAGGHGRQAAPLGHAAHQVESVWRGERIIGGARCQLKKWKPNLLNPLEWKPIFG